MRATPILPPILGLLITLSSATSAHGAPKFAFILDQSASSASTSVSASAPLTGTIIGDPTATPPTRTRVGTNSIFPPSFVTCTPFGATQNDPINISGTLAASGQQSNVHPAGTFTLTVDAAAGTSAVQGLTLNLLGGSIFTINASINQFTYQNICALNPTCALRYLVPITFPLGTITVTSLSAVQDGASAAGTLTGTASNTYDFSIPLNVAVTIAADFSGAPITQPPQIVPVVFSGTVVLSPTGSTASITSTLNISIAPPPSTTPTPIGPSPLVTPPDSALCPGLNLVLAGTITSTTLNSSTSGTLLATGAALCPCDTDSSGTLAPADIFAFLNIYFSTDPRGDFDGNGIRQPQDIFAFLNCYFGRPAGC